MVTLGVFVYSMDLTVLQLAIPSLTRDLRPTSAELLWIIDIYGFVVAGSLITMGTLGDRIGRRRLLMVGAGLFAVVSILAAFSPNVPSLIAARALMGLAGATIAPSTLSLLFVMFRDKKKRALAIGCWLAAFSAGSAAGPMIGGFLIEYYWWGSVFLIAVPIMALLLFLGPRTLPEYQNPNAKNFDLMGAFQIFTAVILMIYAIKEIAQDGFGVVSGFAISAGLLLGAVFIRRQRRLQEPLIDLQLFVLPGIAGALLANIASVFVVVGYFLFVAQYLQLVIGLSPFEAGLWSLPSALTYTIGTLVASRFVHRFRPSILISFCMALGTAGLLLLTRVDLWGQLSVVIPASVLITLSMCPVFNFTTEWIVASAPSNKAGVASGVAETATELGASLGLAVLGSIGIAVYRSEISSAVPEETAESIVISMKDTLGGAVEAFAGLSPDIAEPLLRIAQDAFVQGLRVTALASGVVAIFASGIAYRALRGVQPLPHDAETRVTGQRKKSSSN